MPLYSGDPLTPGVGATKRPEKWNLAEAKTLTKIPVLPISYGDAKPLLAALAGPARAAEWRGALPLTYHVGPGPAKVHLKLAFDWKIVPANDVIARIPGSVWPDEWILHGNHHDAWVNGSEDPVSGMSPLLEEARAFGELVKKGWKPKRTILLCAWDGEEQGLLGSTEWMETHAEELAQQGGRLHQQRLERAGLPVGRRVAHARALRQFGRRGGDGPGAEHARRSAAARPAASWTRRPRRSARSSATERPSGSTRSDRARTTPPSSSTSGSPP